MAQCFFCAGPAPFFARNSFILLCASFAAASCSGSGAVLAKPCHRNPQQAPASPARWSATPTALRPPRIFCAESWPPRAEHEVPNRVGIASLPDIQNDIDSWLILEPSGRTPPLTRLDPFDQTQTTRGPGISLPRCEIQGLDFLAQHGREILVNPRSLLPATAPRPRARFLCMQSATILRDYKIPPWKSSEWSFL